MRAGQDPKSPYPVPDWCKIYSSDDVTVMQTCCTGQQFVPHPHGVFYPVTPVRWTERSTVLFCSFGLRPSLDPRWVLRDAYFLHSPTLVSAWSLLTACGKNNMIKREQQKDKRCSHILAPLHQDVIPDIVRSWVSVSTICCYWLVLKLFGGVNGAGASGRLALLALGSQVAGSEGGKKAI